MDCRIKILDKHLEPTESEVWLEEQSEYSQIARKAALVEGASQKETSRHETSLKNESSYKPKAGNENEWSMWAKPEKERRKKDDRVVDKASERQEAEPTNERRECVGRSRIEKVESK